MNKIKKINKIKKTMACSLALMALMIMGSTETLAVESSEISQGAPRYKPSSRSLKELFTPEQLYILNKGRVHLNEAYNILPHNLDDSSRFCKFSILDLDKTLESQSLDKQVEGYDKMRKDGTISDEEYKNNMKEIEGLRIDCNIHHLSRINNIIKRTLTNIEKFDSDWSKTFSSIAELAFNTKELVSNLKNQYEDNDHQIENLSKFKERLYEFEGEDSDEEVISNESTEEELECYEHLMSRTREHFVDSHNICKTTKESLSLKMSEINKFEGKNILKIEDLCKTKPKPKTRQLMKNPKRFLRPSKLVNDSSVL